MACDAASTFADNLDCYCGPGNRPVFQCCAISGTWCRCQKTTGRAAHCHRSGHRRGRLDHLPRGRCSWPAWSSTGPLQELQWWQVIHAGRVGQALARLRRFHPVVGALKSNVWMSPAEGGSIFVSADWGACWRRIPAGGFESPSLESCADHFDERDRMVVELDLLGP